MREVSVLWLDDDWVNPAAIPKDLAQARAAVEYELAQAGLVARISQRHNGEIWNDLGEQQVDLLILDYELSKQPSAQNAFDLLDRLESRLRSIPPVIVFSQYARHELEAVASSHARRRIHAVFFKDEQGCKDLARCAVQMLVSSPLSFVVMSDLHVGYLDETGGISQQRFLGSLYHCLESVVKEQAIQGLIICGDFAWKHQQPELVQSFTMIQNIALRLGIRSHDQVFFCPGNHDINFAGNAPSWDSYGELVQLLATTDPGYLRRHEHRNTSIGGRRPFHDQASLFSVVHNEHLGLVVVGLNSNRPMGHGVEVQASIDEDQWHALTLALERCPRDVLRIALLHHPVFSAPGGVYQDEKALADQGKALQTLAGAGINLVFHGHTHFSAVHAHRIAILNSPETLNLKAGSGVADLVTVACPSLIAEPSSAAPHRQFMIVKLERIDPHTCTRGLSLRSMVFNPGKCTWSDGSALGLGHFSVGQGYEARSSKAGTDSTMRQSAGS